MRNVSRFIALSGFAAVLAACAGRTLPEAGPSDIPSLEAAVAAEPNDADRLTLLGVAYYEAGRFADATDALARAAAAPAAEAVAHLYLGLAHEQLAHWQQASDAYAAFLASSAGDADRGDVRADIEHRLVLVQRELMKEELRAMLANETALASQPAQPRTVAVLPFRIVSEDARYQPLQVALADMVTTDLGIPGSLRLLERAQIQALVQEMALSLAGYTEAASGARVGRLMRAEHVVQGSVVLLGDEQLRMEMAVVDPAQPEPAGAAAQETAVQQLIDAEKQLVLDVLGVLGVTLTAAEREAIEENRTANLLALLAYGEGLESMDRGDYAAAAAAFQEAVRLDPGFEAAQARGQEASTLQEATQTSATAIAAAVAADLPAAPSVESSAAPEPAVALVDAIIPDINRSGVDLTGVVAPDANPGRPSEDPNSGGASHVTRIPVVIDVDNPNN